MKKQQIKRINKQFYKFWKKATSDCEFSLRNSKKAFCILNRLSLVKNITIDCMVSKLLIPNKEIVFSSEFDEISNLLMIDLSFNEIVLLLGIAGYEINVDGDYYLVDERRGKILNACNAIKCCERSDMILGLNDKLNIFLKNYYYKKHKRYECKSNKISLKYSNNAYKVDPANGERIGVYSLFASKMIIIVGIITFVIVLWWIMSKYANPDNVEKSTISICNSLLAVSFPCFVTLITTYMLIQHEYKVDFHRERMDALPVFSLELMNKELMLKSNKNPEQLNENMSNMFINTACLDIQDPDLDIYKLVNIGNGIGFNVLHDRVDEVFSFGDIPQEKCCYIGIKKYLSLYYTIEYSDIYGNKYTQFFDVEKNEDKCSITSFPPELVLRTRRVRYQQ
jgi:hypothetical protein